MRILLVSSFVPPHPGGVEQFVAGVREMLLERAFEVRILACRPADGASTADAVVPTRYIGRSGWPVPIGGRRTLARELGAADVVLANVSLHPLAVLAVLAARRRGVPAVFVLHGSGAPLNGGSPPFRIARATFLRTMARLAVRRSVPVSVSVAGLEGARRLFGVEGHYLPYPLPELPRAAAVAGPGDGQPLRVAWIGRLFPEKDPLLAVDAVDRLRVARAATLDVYGDGVLRGELEARAATRPWLRIHGSRPWDEVLAVQRDAHACLSTSAWDNVQVAVLESLACGVPVVSTSVGDAPRYYLDPGLARYCVPAHDAAALAEALDELAGNYDALRRAFAVNGERLASRHREAPAMLASLLRGTVRG